MTEYTPGLWWHTCALVWSHIAAVYNADVQLARYAAKARRKGAR